MERLPETYYEILGVPRDAPDREIKEAFRLLARKLHPDLCSDPGAEERFKLVSEAYRVLSDPGERGRYDSLGHGVYLVCRAGARDPPVQAAPPGFHGFGDAFDLFFTEKAWGSPRAFRPRAPSDILARVEVTLEEAVLGARKEVEVPTARRCTTCGGTGSTTGKAWPCPGCGGIGREGVEVAAAPGDLPGVGGPPCRGCGGKGRVPEEPCGACGGWGAIQETRRVPVLIPPGIGSGMRIRKDGLGDGREEGIPRGDLYVEVTILPHARFTRKGDDLELLLHLSPARAALGMDTEVVTIRGSPARVRIPPGVQHDTSVRVSGEGVKTRDRCGDLVLRVRIDIPEAITAGERDLYRRILRIEERRGGTKGGFLARYLPGLRYREK